MNAKLYCTIAAVIATGVIGTMYTIPSAEAAGHFLHEKPYDKIYQYLDQFDQYDNPTTIYEGYGKVLTTEEWIDFFKLGGFSIPLCLYSAETYNCTWRGALYWDYCEHHDEHWGSVVHQWYGDKYNRITEYHFVKYCERLIDTVLYANELFITNMVQKDMIAKLETDINEKNNRITGLESKIGELILIEKAHGELIEELDQKNKLIDNKNKRIDNLREDRRNLEDLAEKRLDKIHNFKGIITETNTSIQDLIDMLEADPNTSTDDILEALRKLLK